MQELLGAEAPLKSKRVRSVRPECERRLQKNPIGRRALGGRIPLVGRYQLRELAREPLEIPRGGSRRSPVGRLVLKRVEAGTKVRETCKLIPREDIRTGEVAVRTCVREAAGNIGPVRQQDTRVALVQLAHELRLQNERPI